MSTETKRREILQMLANGSITAAEAGDLLQQLKTEPVPAPEGQAASEFSEPLPGETEETATERGGKARWLNVRVTDSDTGRNRVSVRIPLSLARIGLRMGAKFAPEMEGIDWDEVLQQLSGSGEQTIVEVNDQDDGESVRIYLS
jgi:hypothetical protein